MLRRARSVYHTAWSQSKNVPVVCSHTPAYAEAYLATNPEFEVAVEDQ